MRRELARGLADAFLAGPPDPESMVARGLAALDTRPAWLRPLAEELLALHGVHWHWNRHRELAAAIRASSHFQKAWQTRPHPRLLRPCLAAPVMAPAPSWLSGPLPDLPTVAALAAFLGLEIAELDALLQSLRYREAGAARRLRHYGYRWLEKRSGGYRLLEIPKAHVRGIQRRILRELLDRVPPHAAAHGFRAGRSCLSHAREHAGRAVVVRLDLADFFLHVGGARVRAMFRSLGYPDGVADALAELCTHRTPPPVLDPRARPGERPEGFPPPVIAAARWRAPHLPQGAPSSPALANLTAFALDLRLAAAAESAGARYSRYADDLVFSGEEEFRRSVQRFIPWVGAIVLDEGFTLNFRKTRVMGRGRRQEVTGLVVNAGTNVPREDYDRIKAMLTNCVRHGPASQTALPLPLFRSRLGGHVAYVAAANPARGAKLRELWARIEWD